MFHLARRLQEFVENGALLSENLPGKIMLPIRQSYASSDRIGSDAATCVVEPLGLDPGEKLLAEDGLEF